MRKNFLNVLESLNSISNTQRVSVLTLADTTIKAIGCSFYKMRDAIGDRIYDAIETLRVSSAEFQMPRDLMSKVNHLDDKYSGTMMDSAESPYILKQYGECFADEFAELQHIIANDMRDCISEITYTIDEIQAFELGEF